MNDDKGTVGNLGALPPPGHEWEMGRTAADISFVNQAQRFLGDPTTSPENRTKLVAAIAEVKSGKRLLRNWLTPGEFLHDGFPEVKVLPLSEALDSLQRRLSELMQPEHKKAAEELARGGPSVLVDLNQMQTMLRQRILSGCTADHVATMEMKEVIDFIGLLEGMEKGSYWAAMSPVSDRVGELWRAALAASHNAYAPYSGFKVGAAILTKSGRIFTGCNVECVDYDGTHAEESALSAMVMAGEREPLMLCVRAEEINRDNAIALPCGKCRQKLREFAVLSGYDFEVIVDHVPHCDDFQVMHISALLPRSFGFEDHGAVRAEL